MPTAVHDLTRLELITEAVRAALEELARCAPHVLTEVIDQERGRRYGRPVRLGKNPTRPETRILTAGEDAWRLLEHLRQREPHYLSGPRVQALRQIVAQNCYCDDKGRLRWRTDADGGLPPSAVTDRFSLRRPGPLRAPGTSHQAEGFPGPFDRDRAPEGTNVITTRPPPTMPRPSPESTPACSVARCFPPSTWSTAAVPPCSTSRRQPANTRSPSAGRCRATPPASTARTKASAATTFASTSTAGR
ncbi:hypothetical protein [Nocardia sp. alder85J]|uniref:hypothetical protein n=1 Tax=Nocardia sp. alder85J TaxID=2862949 RepID=UPI001CD62D3C